MQCVDSYEGIMPSRTPIPLVAHNVDGNKVWSPAVVAPGALAMTISVEGIGPAMWGDVERGAFSVQTGVNLFDRGIFTEGLYASLSTWQTSLARFPGKRWGAGWTTPPKPYSLPGFVGIQYGTFGGYDLSEFDDAYISELFNLNPTKKADLPMPAEVQWGNQVHIFDILPNGVLSHRWFDFANRTPSFNKEVLPGGGGCDTSKGPITSSSLPDGNLHVWAAHPDGSMYHAYQKSGGAWSTETLPAPT